MEVGLISVGEVFPALVPEEEAHWGMPLVSFVLLLDFAACFQKLRIVFCLLGEELIMAEEFISAVRSGSVLAGGWPGAAETCGGGGAETAFVWKAGVPDVAAALGVGGAHAAGEGMGFQEQLRLQAGGSR